MTIQMIVVNAQQEARGVTLAKGEKMLVGKGDTIRLLEKADLQIIRKGNDLIIKNARGEKFVLKDFFVKRENEEEGQLLTWDNTLGQEREVLSEEYSEPILVAANETETLTDAVEGGDVESQAETADSEEDDDDKAAALLLSSSGEAPISMLGAIATVGAVLLMSQGSSGGGGKSTSRPTQDTTSPETPDNAGTAIDDVGPVIGPIPDGGTTDDNRPGLQIPPPGEGETPVLYVDGVEVPATWDPDTNTLTPDDPLDEGEHEITYTLRDEAGNESGQSPGTTLTVDTTAPAKPAAPESYEDNIGEEQSATSTAPVTDDDQPGINIGAGHTDTPTLYIDGIEVPATYDPVTGTLTPDDPVSEGEHDFSWTLTDTAGNESEQSDPLTIEIDTSAPTATVSIDAITDDTGEPGDFITTDQSLTVSGSNSALGAGEKIQISVDGGSTWADVTQSTGTTWQYVDPATHGASFTYEVRIVDAAMNIGNGDTQAVTILGSSPSTGITINSISVDSGVVNNDFITNDNDGLVINATLSAGLGAGEVLQYSNDNGASWSIVDSGNITGTAVSFTDSALTSSNTIKFRVSNGAAYGAEASQLVTIDTTAPTVSSMAITSADGIQNNLLNEGDVVYVTVTLSESVIVSGTPQLGLNIGDSIVQASYSSGSGSNQLVFAYTIQAGQTDLNGISINANSLSLNSGTITDAAGNAATLTHSAITDNAGYMVDTTAPVASFVPSYKLEATGVTNGHDTDSRILTMGTGGEYLVGWTGQDAEGDTSIYLQKFNADGTASGSAIKLEATGVADGDDQINEIRAVGTGGEYLVGWTGQDAEGDNSIYVQKFNADGTASGSAIKLEAAGVADGDDRFMQIRTVGAGGEYVVTWSGQDAEGDYSIYVQKFNADGTVSGSTVKLEATGVTNGHDVLARIVAVGADGEYVVTWYGQDAEGDHSIYVQKFNADGTVSGSAVKLEATGVTNGQDGPMQISTVGAGGEYVVAWTGQDAEGDTSIYVQKFNADGTVSGSAIKIESPGVTNGDDFLAQIRVVDAGGEYFLTWVGQDAGGNDRVYVQKFNADGTASSSAVNFEVITEIIGRQVQVSLLAGGEYVVTWVGPDADGDNSIYVQKFNADGTVSGSTVKLEAAGVTDGNDWLPRVVAVGAAGEYVVTWYGVDTDGDFSVYVQKFNADGTVSVLAQSTETGTAYLVHDSVVVNSLSDITGAADSLWNSVTISAANTSTNLSTAGLLDGNYKLYSVDLAGNLSAPVTSSNATVVDTTAPTLAGSTPADNALAVAKDANIVLTFSEDVLAGTGNIVISNGVDTRTINISDATQISISGNTVTINPTADLVVGTTYNVQMAAGVITDVTGNAYAGISDATTLNFSVTDSIDLGDFGQLINGVQVEGKWYYYWDVNGNGVADGGDSVTHDYLDGIFAYASDFSTANPGSNTTEVYRFAEINGVQLALPTYGSTVDGSGNANDSGSQPGTAATDTQYYQETANSNPTYNDLLAIWDQFNGTGTGTNLLGVPPGWAVTGDEYWSATPGGSGHALVDMENGQVFTFFSDTFVGYVALEVVI